MSVAAVALALSGVLGSASGMAWSAEALMGARSERLDAGGESASGPATVPPKDAFEREAWTRAVALGRASDAEVLASLVSEDWSLRRAAADGLARAERRPSAEVLEALGQAALDRHEGVRECALEAALLWGAALSEEVAADQGDGEVSPAVRLAWARFGPLEAAAARALDPDPWVAEAARWRLFAWGPEAAAEQAAVLRAGVPVEPLLEPLALGGLAASLPDALEGAVDDAILHGWRARLGQRYPALELAWRFEVGADREAVRNEREEVARLGGVALGRALLARHAGDRERQLHPTVRRFLLECAAAALPADEGLAAVLDLATRDAEEAAQLLEACLARWVRPHPRDLMPLLAPELPTELGDRAARALADSLGHDHHREAVEALLPLVSGEDRGRQIESFSWLASAPLTEEEQAALVAAWRGVPEPDRVHRLRFLPRERMPRAFREDLLAFCAREASCTSSVVELLGTWRADEEVEQALAQALDRVLLRLETLEERGPRLEAEARAAERLDALAQVSRSAARAPAARALELVARPGLPTRHRLLKRAVAALAGDEEGRALLEPMLTPRAPQRARYEAALDLCGFVPAAADVLIVLHGSVDRVLQLRGVRALARDRTPSVDAFLERLQGEDGPFEVRSAALEVLAEHGQVGALSRALQDEDFELRLTALDRLAGLEGGAEILRRALDQRLASEPFARMDEFEGSELLDLLRALARHGPVPDALVPLALARPAAAAGSDLAARFAAGSLPSPASRWRAELEAFAALAETGQARAALEASGSWWALDARLLRELAWLARADDSLAGELLTAARVGLRGEADADPTLLASWWEVGRGAAASEVHEARRSAALQRLGRLQRARLPR